MLKVTSCKMVRPINCVLWLCYIFKVNEQEVLPVFSVYKLL